MMHRSKSDVDEVDLCLRKGVVIKAPPPDLVNCAENSILAKQQQQQQQLYNQKNDCKGIFGDAVCNSNSKSPLKTSPLEKLNIFASSQEDKSAKLRKRSEPIKSVMRPKFVKSASLARLLGNNYCTATTTITTGSCQSAGVADASTKSDNSNCALDHSKPSSNSASNVCGGSNGGGKKLEKFHKCTDKELCDAEDEDVRRRASFSAPVTSDGDDHTLDGYPHMSHNSDIRRLRALRTLTKGLGKLLRRRTDSVEISAPDPEYKVSYLGNVLTGWAKGDGCFEKPLSTLWRNYTQNSKPDVLMKIKVCPSGLKATTKAHGLTEYWSNRITYCSSPKNFPRVFCWIYRHEGRRMKHELRCHAVLCTKDVIAKEIGVQLQENLYRALKEFKRDKISRQNARLSLANAVYENPTMPRRKLMLSVGGNNYRPPLERSKSAPKLMAIEEDEDEEDQEEDLKTATAMTLGRRSWANRKDIVEEDELEPEEDPESGAATKQQHQEIVGDDYEVREIDEIEQQRSFKLTPSISQYDDEDEEEADENHSLSSDYESHHQHCSSLEGEIMSYFDMKLNDKSTSLEDICDEQQQRKVRNFSVDCLLDPDDIIAQLIRSRPQSITPTSFRDDERGPQSFVGLSDAYDQHHLSHRHHLTPGAASESDEPATPRFQHRSSRLVQYAEPEAVASDESLDSSTAAAAFDKVPLASQFSEESQLEMDLQRPQHADDYFSLLGDRVTRTSTNSISPTTQLQQQDSDSDVSDESGFIEDTVHNSHRHHQQQQRVKFPLGAEINKADNSILV